MTGKITIITLHFMKNNAQTKRLVSVQSQAEWTRYTDDLTPNPVLILVLYVSISHLKSSQHITLTVSTGRIFFTTVTLGCLTCWRLPSEIRALV